MKKREAVSILKPTVAAVALQFADGSSEKPSEAIAENRQGVRSIESEKTVKSSSGQIPVGDVRLTANISEQHHMKLKMTAVRNRTTIGELLEQLIDRL